MTDSKTTVWTDYHVLVPMRDGIRLSADIYRPNDTKDGARVPAILARTPYNKSLLQEKTLQSFKQFVQNGYAVVFMDVRGRGDSEGEFVPYRNDGRDGYDTIEWIAAQGWCSGQVGTMGGSYLGRIQWLTALEHPPHLKAMIVLVTPSDPFVECPTGTQGPMHICWYHMTSGHVMQNADFVNWMPIYEHLPLMTMDEAVGRVVKNWREDLAHTWLDEYWKAICYQDKFHQISLPVMHISGWYDDEQIGTPLNFRGMTSSGQTEFARKNQKLLMGPWGHATNASSKVGEVEFGPQAIIDLTGEQVRWFDRWLKEKVNTDLGAPVRLFLMGENKWLDENEFPLARTLWTEYFLHSGGKANSRFGDGTLSTHKPGQEGPDQFHYDPARPVPFLTEPTSSQIGGPDDYAAVERRDDVLVYATPPLEEDTTVIGPIKLELYASSSAVDTDFTAKLVDVHPTGFVQRLCDSMVRARFREGMDKPSPIEPGKIYRYSIDMWNTCLVFFKGHRIALEISSSAFPKYDRNLNTGEDPATSTRIVPADQVIYHDADHPSALTLPIIPR